MISCSAKRIIPCLDVTAGRVVKGTRFLDLRDAGDPVECAKLYDEQGADELVFLDIRRRATIARRWWMSSRAPRSNVSCRLPSAGEFAPRRISGRCCCGCGQGEREHRRVMSPVLITEAAESFGSQCVVVAIDAKRDVPGKWRVYTHGGRYPTELDAIAWAREVTRLGAGEILLTSMDADGTCGGYDIELTRAVSAEVEIPVIASGGAGELEHLAEVLLRGNADASWRRAFFTLGLTPSLKRRNSLQGGGLRFAGNASLLRRGAACLRDYS